MPGADVGKRAQPVDAGIGPEIYDHDFSAEGRRGQRRRIEPFVRALKRGQLGLTGRLSIEKAMEKWNSDARRCRWLRHGDVSHKGGNWDSNRDGEYGRY